MEHHSEEIIRLIQLHLAGGLTEAEQKALEEKWIADLNKKFPVTVNWKLLKKLRDKKE